MTLVLAMLLDAALGEPKWLWDRIPHPAVLMGRVVDWVDRTWNTGRNRRAMGIVAMALMALAALVVGDLLAQLGPVVEVIVAAILLAQRSLADHVSRVANALRLSTSDGRRAVSMIVGRDTAEMDRAAVSRAAIESGAENLSDGVIAPAFWFVILGLPGILLYKVTNTADSMIGYKTPRHSQFGWAAAKFDDLLNWIPARLTAALTLLADLRASGWDEIARDAKRHRSPNAGWPEAAFARALDVSLSGPRSYEGQMRDFPWVHATGRKDLGPEDIDRAVTLLWRVWTVAIVITLVIAIFT